MTQTIFGSAEHTQNQCTPRSATKLAVVSTLKSTLAGAVSLLALSTYAHADAVTIINNDVGVGTATPAASMHIYRNNAREATLSLESQGGGNPTQWTFGTGSDNGQLTLTDVTHDTTPLRINPNTKDQLLGLGTNKNDTITVQGYLVVSGNCNEQTGACADYVFENDYPLRPLDELKTFITTHKHLPNIPAASDMQKNGVDIAGFSGRLLEKVEELTLYTLAQEDTIESLQTMMQKQQAQIERLLSVVEDMSTTDAN